MKRKIYSNRLKSKVALAAIKGQKTTNKIASKFVVHISQANRWKKQAQEGISDIFGGKKDKTIQEVEAERGDLFRKIGQLQVEVDWLKKHTGICHEHQSETSMYRSSS